MNGQLMNYYEKQLQKLEKSLPVSIQLTDARGNSTKWMDLNNESIPALEQWLKENKVYLTR